jgi:hypothetical protein
MTKKTSSYYIGKRKKSKDIDIDEVLTKAQGTVEFGLPDIEPQNSLRNLKLALSTTCRDYYTACAVSRRKILPENLRDALLYILFPFRTTIEREILKHIERMNCINEITKEACTKSFFGASIKQGVGIRYPLTTCHPTKNCMGKCYGHDGRDRELHLIFRAVLNFWIGERYEHGSQREKSNILKLLKPAIDYALKVSINDAKTAKDFNFDRLPRVRFSQIGEMIKTPKFANELAKQIKAINPETVCAIYTRLPIPHELDQDLFVINYTWDSDVDFHPIIEDNTVNYVASSWNGVISKDADINFLEHHVEKASNPVGIGDICPVTRGHKAIKSCDEAKCDVCFRPHR